MMRFVLAAALAAILVTTADARGRRCRSAQPSATTPSCSACSSSSAGAVSATTAQAKAEAQAAEGRMRHVGAVPPGCHEGVGFSSVSAEDAIRHCCYWGQLPPREIGVARGPAGFYATVIYGR